MRREAILTVVCGLLCVVLCGSGCRFRQHRRVETPAPNTVIAGGMDAPSPDKGSKAETPPDEADSSSPLEIDKDTSGAGNPQESIETATVQVGEAYEVCLRENRTTAYKWEYEAEPARGAVVLSDEYIPDPNPQKAVGTGGTHIWAFSLRKPGQVTITFELGAGGKGILSRRTCVLTASE